MRIKKTSTHGLTLILDAYNVIHLIPALERTLDAGLSTARLALVRLCQKFKESKGNIGRMVLVFDGTRRRSLAWDLMPTYEGDCEIIFSDAEQTADDKIVEILEKIQCPESTVVVSSDNYVANNARAHQVRVLSVEDFNDAVRGKRGSQEMGSTAIDADAERAITAEYRNYLGIKE